MKKKSENFCPRVYTVFEIWLIKICLIISMFGIICWSNLTETFYHALGSFSLNAFLWWVLSGRFALTSLSCALWEVGESHNIWHTEWSRVLLQRDDVIKWKQLALCAGIHRSPVHSPHIGQWRGALMFSLIYAWINGWVNNLAAGDLRRHRAHYDVIVMRMRLV